MQQFEKDQGAGILSRFYLHLVDATDGYTPETGEAGGQPQISKNGAAFADTTNTLVAVGNGLYYVQLTATELDSIGYIAVRYKSANTREFQALGQVVQSGIWNSAVNANVTLWNGSTPQDLSGGFVLAIAYSLGPTAEGQVNAQVDSALDTAIPGSPTADSINERVKAIDDKLPSKAYLRGTADSDGGMDAEDKADVNAEADTALTDYDPPTKAEMDSGFAALNDPSAAENASAVWSAATRSLTDKAGFTLTAAERDNIAGAVLTLADAIESGVPLDDAIALILAAVSGETSGYAAGPGKFYAPDGTTVRLQVTNDADGNRTSVTRYPP